MDAIDRAIISELLLNCRLSYEALGVKHGLSTSSVWRRVKLLQDEGVIERFSLNIHPNYVFPRIVFVIIDFEDSVDEEYVVDSLFSNSLVFNISSIINGICILDIEILKDEEYDSFEKFVYEIESVKSIHSFKGINPPNDRNCVVSIPKFTDAEKQIIKHLMEDPRMQVGEMSNATGFSSKKVNRILGDLTRDHRLLFSARARVTRKGCISFFMKIKLSDHQRSIDVDNWIEENISEYWYSFTSQDALFPCFLVDDSVNTRQISEKIKNHPEVVSTRSFIRVPYKKRPKIGERMLRDLIEGTSSHIE
ncbi:MAG: winged helix-turn-helix transcriptional regulator [Candidatus Thorarchaeota archaeon]